MIVNVDWVGSKDPKLLKSFPISRIQKMITGSVRKIQGNIYHADNRGNQP